MIEARDRAQPASTTAGKSEAVLAVSAGEMATYREHLPELLRRQEGQFILITGTDVLGVSPDGSAAMREGYHRFGIVPFLVRQIAASEPAVYLSNVAP
jgi:hypothetical protein